MTKLIVFLLVSILIIGTSIIKKSTKDIDDEIYSVKENVTTSALFDVVGPVCETADFFGKDRHITTDIGELVVIQDAGAYGFVLSSNYNSRPRIAEYLISNNRVVCIRGRETFSDILGDEEKYLE